MLTKEYKINYLENFLWDENNPMKHEHEDGLENIIENYL
jgi:hypothetical protein